MVDETDWVVYDESNSDFTGESPTCIAISPDGSVWIGTKNDGVFKFDQDV